MEVDFVGITDIDNLCLHDLLPSSRIDLDLSQVSGDEELFRATAKTVLELEDCGSTDPYCVTEVMGWNYPSLVAKHGRPAIERMATFILGSEIPAFSATFQALFDDFNQKYFSGRLDRYQVQVIFDLYTLADEPEQGSLSSFNGLIQIEERRIYIRYREIEHMREILIHEMAHAATSGDHDERWLNEMVRLQQAGAPVPDWELVVR